MVERGCEEERAAAAPVDERGSTTHHGGATRHHQHCADGCAHKTPGMGPEAEEGKGGRQATALSRPAGNSLPKPFGATPARWDPQTEHMPKEGRHQGALPSPALPHLHLHDGLAGDLLCVLSSVVQ